MWLSGHCCFAHNSEKVMEACNTQQKRYKKYDKIKQDSSRLRGNTLHTDICGICPSEANTVSVNEPWQVLTMLAAGSEALCVIMHP